MYTYYMYMIKWTRALNPCKVMTLRLSIPTSVTNEVDVLSRLLNPILVTRLIEIRLKKCPFF